MMPSPSSSSAAVTFIAAFGLMNIVGEWVCPNFDANLWWVDWRPLGHLLGPGRIAVGCTLLLTFAVRPRMRRWRLTAARLTTAALLLLAIINAAKFYILLIDGEIASSFPVPFSVLVMAGLTWAMLSLRPRPTPDQAPPRPSLLRQLAFAGAFAISFVVNVRRRSR